MRFVVVGDTNFYRAHSDSAIEELCELEERIGAVAMGTYLATSELLSHVADPQSASHLSCRAAARRLHRHCFAGEPPDAATRLIPHPHVLLAQRLFPGSHPGEADAPRVIRHMIIDVAYGATVEEHPKLGEVLAIVRRHRDKLESQFRIMLESIRQDLGCDPEHPSEFPPSERPTPADFIVDPMLRSIAARAIVGNVAAECGAELTDTQVAGLASELARDIPTTVEVFVETVRKVLLDGMSTTRAANSIWDMYFALFAASGLGFLGVPAILVTNDFDILRAAQATGADQRVLSPPAYKRLLKRHVAGEA